MVDLEPFRSELARAMDAAGSPPAAADLLCRACVELLEVDGASVSVMHESSTWGTFGASGEFSRRLDALQFTLGEGPCLEVVRSGKPVSAPDLDDPAEQRWPAFRTSLLDAGILAVFALPIAIASTRLGALDLFRRRSGPLGDESATGALLAAELAALPLLKLMSHERDGDTAGQGGDGGDELASLERVEVYQATGS